MSQSGAASATSATATWMELYPQPWWQSFVVVRQVTILQVSLSDSGPTHLISSTKKLRLSSLRCYWGPSRMHVYQEDWFSSVDWPSSRICQCLHILDCYRVILSYHKLVRAIYVYVVLSDENPLPFIYWVVCFMQASLFRRLSVAMENTTYSGKGLAWDLPCVSTICCDEAWKMQLIMELDEHNTACWKAF